MGSVSLIDGHIDDDMPKMTDEQIIQAYACCNISDFGGCDNCPCQIEDECIIRTKGFDLEREVFNVFNRLKAEIERLKEKLNHSIGIDNTKENGYFPFD